MLGAALAAQPALHERALAQRVVLVGPGALMALLRTVAFTWQQDSLSASARELLDLGRDLHRRLATLGAHTAKVGRSLQSSVEAYNAMVGALESRVMVTARRMHDLDLVGDDIPVLTPVETAPRPLTSQELIDAATAEEARPDLLLDLEGPTPSPATATPAEPAARPGLRHYRATPRARPWEQTGVAPATPAGGGRRPRRDAHGGPLQSSDCPSRLVGRQGTLDNGGACPLRAPSVENGGP